MIISRGMASRRQVPFNPWFWFIIKNIIVYKIPLIRRSYDRLISTTGFPIPARRYLRNESEPKILEQERSLHYGMQSKDRRAVDFSSVFVQPEHCEGLVLTTLLPVCSLVSWGLQPRETQGPLLSVGGHLDPEPSLPPYRRYSGWRSVVVAESRELTPSYHTQISGVLGSAVSLYVEWDKIGEHKLFCFSGVKVYRR